jgi:phosphomethylpyrimidine synthase
MKITQDVRDYAASLGDNEKRALGLDAVQAGMKEMSDKFNAMGQQVYIDAEKVKESNKVL